MLSSPGAAEHLGLLAGSAGDIAEGVLDWPLYGDGVQRAPVCPWVVDDVPSGSFF